MINDSILKKTGPLTKMEYNLIKEHPNIGGKIVKPCLFPNSIVNIIKFHHERWDGEGYPNGLSKKIFHMKLD